jgi:hypothetical protein
MKLGGSWSLIHLEPWEDTSWIGAEGTRRVIRQRALSEADVFETPPGGGETPQFP